METLSRVFKALSEPLRLRIMHRLLQNGKEAYGEELAGALGIPAYQLSRHLKVLKTTGLVSERREGRWVYYSLAKHPGNGHVLGLLRRLLATAKVPATGGNGRQAASKDRGSASLTTTLSKRSASKGRKRRAKAGKRRLEIQVKSEEFNWNEGPAVPGIL